MNILLIGHEQDFNGASRSLLNIADLLVERNHNVHILTSYHSGSFYGEIKKRNIRVIVAPYYRWCVVRGSRFGWIKKRLLWHLLGIVTNIRTAKSMAKYCLEQHIDIIHTNTSVINIGALISKYGGFKHVWHIREFADEDFNMYPLVSNVEYYGFMNKFTDCFICVSKAVADHYNLLDPKKKCVIYNGIISAGHSSVRIKHKGRKIRILIAGRLNPAKGQDEAAMACVELWKQGIKDFELLIAGNGKRYFDIPEEFQEYVSFLGQVDDMVSLRQTVDIELMCSKAEAFGRVTAEAMLAGIPVVGSNTGGTPELIQDGVTGFLYEKGNIKQLADKLSILILNEELRIKMGYASREIAARRFSIERCVDEIEQVYRSLIP